MVLQLAMQLLMQSCQAVHGAASESIPITERHEASQSCKPSSYLCRLLRVLLVLSGVLP
jgi:hypothetical protein